MKDLFVFLALANHLNFSSAARELGVSQPAVSQNIKELELRLDVQLFVRTNSKVGLTPAGEVLKSYAEKIIELYKEMDFELKKYKGSNDKDLIIGASAASINYLTSYVLKFLSENHDLNILLKLEEEDEIETKVEAGILDVGIIEEGYRKENLDYTPLVEESLCLVTSFDNNVEEISFQDIGKLPMVLLDNKQQEPKWMKRVLKKYNIEWFDLNIKAQVGDISILKKILQNGDIYSIMSNLSILEELENQELKTIRVRGLNETRNLIAISLNRPSKKILKNFFLSQK